MTDFWKELKQALRRLWKTPGFTLAALIVLALGIGANTAIFSIVNGVLLRPLPYGHPDRLVQLYHVPPARQFPGMDTFSLSAANYLDWERQNTVFESSAIYSFTSLRMTGSGDPKVLRGSRVETTFFPTLEVQPLLGRTLLPGDEQPGHEHVIVLSHKLWKSDLGGNREIVGKNIELNGQAYTVVGVMPASFDKPDWATFWTPLVWDPAEKAVRGEHHFLAVARLKAGVSLAQAQANLSTIAARLAQQYPADDAGWGAKVIGLREDTVGEVREPLFILLGAVVFVLLIACANMANLILAKTLDRRKEIAIRTALGANRRRVMAHVLTEAILMSVAGGALGLIVAQYGTKIVVDFFGSNLPRVGEIRVDATVLGFTFAIAVLTGIVAGAWPAWRMSKADPQDALKQGGRTDAASGGRRTRNALVVVEVALSLVLLVGAGLLIRTLWNLRGVNPGFDPDHVITMSVGVAATDYSTPEQESMFLDEVLRRVRALPGVKAAGVTDTLPLTGGGSIQPVAVEGQPSVDMSHQPEVAVRIVSPGFFEAMRIPLIRGRVFSESDTGKSSQVVIISEAMARQFWPNENPIGKRLALTFSSDKMREVVGVVGNVKDEGLDSKAPESMLYYPISQMGWAAEHVGKFHSFPLQMAVRTGMNPADATGAIRAAVHAVSANTPILDVKTMDDWVSESIAPQRFNMILLATFAGLALFLAAVGIYGVLAYAVRRRVREIGVRMALGAQIEDVLRMIVVEGLRPTLLGVVIGLAAALALSRVLSTLVFGVKATDITTFVTVSVILVSVGLFASILPAYRATRVDPLKTLREE
ncbi:MAG: ABC transporter permease [Terriglobia bacterium]|nr:ABC transporter permease [Terriglobia bacterium]